MRRLLLEIGRALKGFGKPVRDILNDQRDSGYVVLSPFLNSLCICGDESFGDSWCESLRFFNLEKKLFNPDEMKLLLSFGKNFGYGDTDEQVELIKVTAEYFEEFEKRAGEEALKQGKLKLMLPIYAGMVVCILII